MATGTEHRPEFSGLEGATGLYNMRREPAVSEPGAEVLPELHGNGGQQRHPELNRDRRRGRNHAGIDPI